MTEFSQCNMKEAKKKKNHQMNCTSTSREIVSKGNIFIDLKTVKFCCLVPDGCSGVGRRSSVSA